jgi:zinc and cadmium transporter
MALFYAFLSVIIVSAISLMGLFVLNFNEKLLRRTIFILVSLSVGALFGDAFFHLIPEAFEVASNSTSISVAIIVGILLFFVLEKFLLWHHNHGEDAEEAIHGHEHDHTQVKPLGYMVLFSDGIHNFIDGLIIGASYFISIEVGIATTIAISLHEIPQEIGDFGVLLHAGFTRAKALFFNFLSACAAILGVFAAVFVGEMSENVGSIVAAFAAGGFIYIAGSDIVPELHKTKGLKNSLVQFGAIVVGVLAMYLLLFLE